ncbi:MAG: hypothetical protein CL508_05215 [Actinobacteria bacterium]|nr:hypothetical protein [Actinomycetota bacterium]MBO71697.1 hypothetical protein [Actinomycetota bacterium]|tara:strand:+ start:22964 stop:23413 length:450 start_codon:yes stop_codon:yes gene_type:complete
MTNKKIDKITGYPKGVYKEGSTISSMREPTIRPDIPSPEGTCIFCRKNTSSTRACYSCREVDFKVDSKEHEEYLASIHDTIAIKDNSIKEGNTDSVTDADYESKLLLYEDSVYNHEIEEGCCSSHKELFEPYCKTCSLKLPYSMVCDYC